MHVNLQTGGRRKIDSHTTITLENFIMSGTQKHYDGGAMQYFLASHLSPPKPSYIFMTLDFRSL
mgnify:CR=1 FL=1